MPSPSTAARSGFPEQVRDACGVVLLADLSGRPRSGILPMALSGLRRLAHRGAVDGDGRTGDGAGVLTQIPFEVLRPEIEALGLSRRQRSEIGVGVVFLPRPKNAAARARKRVSSAIAAQDLIVAGWREVPIDEDALGQKARLCRPAIAQLFVIPRIAMTPDDFEERLFRARREVQARVAAYGPPELYIASLSHRTIVYKALVRSLDLDAFYPDLRNPEYVTSFAIAHQRFSTNTFPSWSMAQPFHLLAHNGEINTIAGNRNWMRARAARISDRFGRVPSRPRETAAARAAGDAMSDSATLDEALSILTAAGRELPHAMTMLMPPAWENDARISGARRALLDYQASVMEPWDGPALVAFSDGRVAGAALDRNGLRPARYVVTGGGLLAIASEAGAVEVDESDVVRRGRLGPGEMLVVDLEKGRIQDRDEVLRRAAGRGRYGRWIAAQRSMVEEVRAEAMKQAPFINRGSMRDSAPSPNVRRAFGYTRDEVQLVLRPMFEHGIEPIASMGDDTPLAVLSSRPRLLFSYFKQRFAQVTNPPIDPLRESSVMSLETRLGRAGDFLSEGPLPGPHVVLQTPVVRRTDLRALLSWERKGWRAHELTLRFEARGGESGFAAELDRLLAESARAVREGTTCLVLTDRGVDAGHAAIPSLLAVSAVHQHLIRQGLRLDTGLVAYTGEVRDDHQLAALLAFGADAVCPYLVFEMIGDAVRERGGSREEVDAARARYRGALAKGLLKILSKMGVSTLRSYRGAQLFEAIGISGELIEAHFTGTPSFVEGLGLAGVARETLDRHAAAFAPDVTDLDEAGMYRYRRGGEAHAYEPRVAKALHRAVVTGERLDYRAYSDVVHARQPVVLRDLLEFRTAIAPVSIESVEPLETIVRRFMTAAMSLGALSPEAQEVLAVAMNRLGARSNSGEGGELPGQPRAASHRIKQIASARFGVSAAYLASADEIQIKIAQGSKPGEGGQLPGQKVTPLIGRVRHAAPGTTLISPPPHHDIYSIEDLAQLVYDLKQVNPAATVSVKLVSSAGIGTIAVGVAKAYADAIEISGHDGGTGASPIGSIRNAGTPWELGLAEAHQALVRAGLRQRVKLQVNGGLKTGRDVVVAALLGAEEFGFGSAALVAAGCVMARQCHLNTCPAGIATQREDLRAKFKGTAQDVIRFFTAVAGEVREILALLGATTLQEIVGHSDLLTMQPALSGKAATVRLDAVLARAADAAPNTGVRNDPPATGKSLDDTIVRCLALDGEILRPMILALPITTADRSVGAGVAGHLARTCRAATIAPETVHVLFRGSAGQSFGAFCVEGMRLELAGVANDGVAKGMSGGEVVIRSGLESRSVPDDVVAGNATLYGATGGRLFVAGCAGERFAVRNSGAIAVVEGTGDHACEYMTAGVVVILGSTGVNVGAGMTGGTLLIAGAADRLAESINRESVVVRELSPYDESLLRDLLIAHRDATGSLRAASLLENWKKSRLKFRRIVPIASVAAVPQSVSQLQIEQELNGGMRAGG